MFQIILKSFAQLIIQQGQLLKKDSDGNYIFDDKKLTKVKAGEDDTDVINKKQLDDKKTQLENLIQSHSSSGGQFNHVCKTWMLMVIK